MAILKLRELVETKHTQEKDQVDLYNVFLRTYESLEDGVVFVNLEGKILYANPAYCQYFDYEPRDIMGKYLEPLQMDPAMKKLIHEQKNSDTKHLTLPNKHVTLEVKSKKVSILDESDYFMVQYRPQVKQPIHMATTSYHPVSNPFKEDFYTKHLPLIQELEAVKRAAQTPMTLLIRGESGTGKEVIAKAIHKASQRRGRFVAVNCGAIPSGLIESELFGHEEGAFTGAVRSKEGLVAAADGGTLFLDEIGDLPLEAQVKLLRLLQEKTYTRVGCYKTIRTDLRVIAATHQPLETLIENGQFREDLYYRLSIMPLVLPPLRERPEDIEGLLELLSQGIAQRYSLEPITFTADALETIKAHQWPGNVRALENVIERLTVVYSGACIDHTLLPTDMTQHYIHKDSYVRTQVGASSTLIGRLENGDIGDFEMYEREIIRLALARHGSFNAAGKALGLTHKTVAAKARKYGIS